MRQIQRVLLCICLLVFSGRALAAEMDTKLDEFFRAYLEDLFRMQRMTATSLGDHRFDGELDDLSQAAQARNVGFAKTTLRRLQREVDYSRLTRDSQIDFEIFKHELETAIWLEENTRPMETNPRAYNEYISDSVFLLLTQSTLPKETNISNAVSRIGQIPKVIAAARENLKNPPKPVLETAILQNRGSIDFYEKDLFDVVGDTPQMARLKAAAANILPDLKAYQKYLENDLLAQAKGDWRLGKKRFYKKLELILDAGMNADQVLAAAQSEFTQVRMEMFVVARQLWSRYFPGQAIPPDDEQGRAMLVRRVIDAVNLEHGKPENLVRDARDTVVKIKKFIAEKDILTLPEPDQCQIIEMPKFQRGNSLAYLNPAPPLDARGSSFYAISPPTEDWDPKRVESLLREYNSHMLQILTIHEGYPGHYVQLEYANRTKSHIRRVLGSGVFAEGWAVYTERVMLDQGYGEGDPRLRLMQLKFYLRAVANAILDHRLHCGEWDDETTMKFLVDDAFQSQEEARAKIVRAKQTSVQLSTYFVGRTAFYRLRQQTERAMGDKFNLGRYHEAVLSHGSIPVKYLPEVVGRDMKQ